MKAIHVIGAQELICSIEWRLARPAAGTVAGDWLWTHHSWVPMAEAGGRVEALRQRQTEPGALEFRVNCEVRTPRRKLVEAGTVEAWLN